jgi:hypothetical protein
MAQGRPRQRYRAPDLRFFAERTSQSLYWLGFLMADGCVTSRELIVVLHRRDEDHLRVLLKALGCSDRPLASANSGAGSRLAIGSVALARQLASLGIVPHRARSQTGVLSWMASSADFWRGVVDGDGSIKFHPRWQTPSLEVVGAPGLMRQLARFLEAAISDGRPVNVFRHSQSTRVRLVKVGGRRAQVALRALYPPGVVALERKRERARVALMWQPKVRSRYPWDRWGNGDEWVLDRGRDYDDGRRLWEAGRSAARTRGLRFLFVDEGDRARVRFAPRSEGADFALRFRLRDSGSATAR